MTNDERQQDGVTREGLTAVELTALSLIATDNVDIEFAVWQQLQIKGLAAYDEGSDADYLTDAGRRVLASAEAAQPAEAPPTNARPTTITVREFTEGGYEGLVNNGKCIVKDLAGNPIIQRASDMRGQYHLLNRFDGEKYLGKLYDHFDELTVEWLTPQAQEGAQPATPTAEEASYNVTYLVEAVEVGIGTEYLKYCDEAKDALHQLVQQLAAVTAERDGLREAMKAVKILTSTVELSLCYFPDKPRLKEFETASEYDIAYEKWSAMNSVVESLAHYNRVQAASARSEEGGNAI